MPYNEQQGIWAGGASADPMVRALRGGAMNRSERRKPIPGLPGYRPNLPGRGSMGPIPLRGGGVTAPGGLPMPGRMGDPRPMPSLPGNTGPLPPSMPGRMGGVGTGGNTPAMPVSMPPTGGELPPDLADPANQPMAPGGGGVHGMPAPGQMPVSMPPTGGNMPPQGVMNGGPIGAPPMGPGMPAYGPPKTGMPGNPFGGSLNSMRPSGRFVPGNDRLMNPRY